MRPHIECSIGFVFVALLLGLFGVVLIKAAQHIAHACNLAKLFNIFN
jgi:hypothetical protein